MHSWLYFTNLDLDGGYQHILPPESNLSQGLGAHFLSQFGSLVDMSFYHSHHFIASGSVAVQETFSCIAKFAGALFIWSATKSNSNISRNLSKRSKGHRNHISSSKIEHVTSSRQNPFRLHFGSASDAGSGMPVFLAKVASSSFSFLWKQVQKNQALPVLSLAAALIPPFDNLSSKALADSISIKDHNELVSGCADGSYRGCNTLSMPNIIWPRDAIEPITGIKFPTVLDCSLGGEDDDHLTTEVLVGIGSRSMRVVKIKSLKVYAFGLYVQPESVCEKLGPKYASVPIDELKNRSEFFEDLLKEDIHMTVRLVVNCSGVKISTVRDAFEKSLRSRLEKMNPCTDYNCLRAFGSYFQQEIPLPVGTTIDFRQTTDGQLITEVGGKLIGSVHSKDLCRAFFDMYIGEFPVSVQTKHEIAQNVAGLMRRC